MHDEIITANEIYLQDVVCDVVTSNPQEDDLVLYNKIVTMVDVLDFETTSRILTLIRLNKTALITT